MAGIARLGDVSSHQGYIISNCADKVSVDGKPLAINGCLHYCPYHGITPMTSNSTMKVEGQSVIRENIDQANCGAVIISASPTASCS